ncbi:MAG: leucyl/phenylalanyl-tRNA--protein transferase [Ginsengibacter sp.]
MVILSKEIFFPTVTDTDEDGLYAIGGDLSSERLLLAYRKGIFPWFNEDEPICWYSPDPRFILLPTEIKVSKSMQAFMKKNVFSFTINKSFNDVIENCRKAVRKYGPGTWISNQVLEAYKELNNLGFAESVEVWEDDKLVGGLYGVKMGKVFFGESMFSLRSNASKFGFIKYVSLLQSQGIQLIDCQVYTSHLESLGARPIPRVEFLDLLQRYL